MVLEFSKWMANGQALELVSGLEARADLMQRKLLTELSDEESLSLLNKLRGLHDAIAFVRGLHDQAKKAEKAGRGNAE